MEALSTKQVRTRIIQKGHNGPEPAFKEDERVPGWLTRVNQAFGVEDVAVGQYLVSTLAHVFRKDNATGVEHLIHYRGKPIRHINTAWQTALRNAGIKRNIRPYDLRHAFGTELIAAGVDVGTVANLMGHSSPMMLLKHYQYVLAPQKKAAVEALPSIAM